MKDTKKTGTNDASAQLVALNRQIEELKQQKTALAGPMKEAHAALRSQLSGLEIEIRELDPSWKPASLRPRADDKIHEIIAANGGPMTEAEIITAVGNAFTKFKVKQTLKKRFAMKDGKWGVPA